MITLTRPRRRKHRQGALAVEMALTIPVYLLFLFGCYEMARATFLRHAAEAAAYEGAREGIVPGATANDVRRQVASMLNRVGARNSRITITPAVITPTTRKVKVNVRVGMADNTVIGKIFTRQMVLVGECELFREGALETDL